MNIRRFDMRSVPYMQGEAIKTIAQSTHAARIIDCGEATNYRGEGAMLYLRTAFSKGPVTEVESLWLDDGVSASCHWLREHRGATVGPWKRVGEDWTDPQFAVTFDKE